MANPYLLAELNSLAAIIHDRNVRLGFYEEDKVRPFDGQLMNVVSEVSEAQEEWRNGRGLTETYWSFPNVDQALIKLDNGRVWVYNYEWGLRRPGDGLDIPEWLELTPELLRRMPNMYGKIKPEGIPSELADIIIRVLDICGHLDIDIANALADKMAYNETRPYRHGGKLS